MSRRPPILVLDQLRQTIWPCMQLAAALAVIVAVLFSLVTP